MPNMWLKAIDCFTLRPFHSSKLQNILCITKHFWLRFSFVPCSIAFIPEVITFIWKRWPWSEMNIFSADFSVHSTSLQRGRENSAWLLSYFFLLIFFVICQFFGKCLRLSICYLSIFLASMFVCLLVCPFCQAWLMNDFTYHHQTWCTYVLGNCFLQVTLTSK